MSKVRIDDFVLTLGFDGSPVKRGLSDVEKSLKSLSGKQVAHSRVLLKNEQGIYAAKNKSLLASVQATKQQNEQRRLTRAKFNLEKEMLRAKNKGIKVDIEAQRAIGKGYSNIYRVQQLTDNIKRANFIKDQQLIKQNKAERANEIANNKKLNGQKAAEREKEKARVRELNRVEKLRSANRKQEYHDMVMQRAKEREADYKAARKLSNLHKQERHNIAMEREREALKMAKQRRINNSFGRGFGGGFGGVRVPFLGALNSTAWGLVKSFTTLSVITGTVTALFGGLAKNISKQVETERAMVGVEGLGRALTFNEKGGQNATVAGTDMTPQAFFKDSQDFLIGMVNKFGTELPAATETWRAVLGASIKQIRDGEVSVDQLKQLMVGVSASATAFKMDAENQSLMWLGVTQIMQKGKVQAEELTKQIGQRNPLALQAMVKATAPVALKMGLIKDETQMTHEIMYKMMKNGQILAKDVMPEWGRQLEILSMQMMGVSPVDYMERSVGGAIQILQSRVGLAFKDIFIDDSFKPIASLISTIRQMFEELRFITDPMGAYIGDIATQLKIHLLPLQERLIKANKEYMDNTLKDASTANKKSQDIYTQVENAFRIISDFSSGFVKGFSQVYDIAKYLWTTIIKPMVSGLNDSIKTVATYLGFSTEEESTAKMYGHVLGILAAWKLMGSLPIIGSLLSLAKLMSGKAFLMGIRALALGSATTSAVEYASVGAAAKGVGGALAVSLIGFAGGAAILGLAAAGILSYIKGDGGKSQIEGLYHLFGGKGDLPDQWKWLYTTDWDETKKSFKRFIQENLVGNIEMGAQGQPPRWQLFKTSWQEDAAQAAKDRASESFWGNYWSMKGAPSVAQSGAMIPYDYSSKPQRVKVEVDVKSDIISATIRDINEEMEAEQNARDMGGHR